MPITCVKNHRNPKSTPTHMFLSCLVQFEAERPNAMHPIYLIVLKLEISNPHRIRKAVMINKIEETTARFLQPRINLLNNILPSPSRPIATSLRDSRRQLDLLDFIRVRDRVDVQAAGHVPGYVAVESCDLDCQCAVLL